MTESTLPEIRNPALRAYAGIYVDIYRDFMDQVRQTGLEIARQDTSAEFAERVIQLRNKGATIRNSDKSIYINHISPACLACKTGNTSATFFISLKCHRDCFYCFNPNQEEYDHYRVYEKDTIAELDALRKFNKSIKYLALTGGEPLLFKDETYRFFKHARQQFPAAFTRLYTCGDHIDADTLEQLRDVGLNEIRFSLRMHDLAKGHMQIFDQIALAKSYIPNVMVEMPVLPNTLDAMKDVLLRLESLGIFGINLLEFCFPWNNANIYRQRGYQIKARPFRVLYNYWYAGGLPVAGSETICLDLIEFALKQGLKLGVHYCSLENKHTGQICRQNYGHLISKTLCFSQKDYFYKSAKVFGDDIPLAQIEFEKTGYGDYKLDMEKKFMEFHVNRIRSLSKLDIEIGISNYVVEKRGADMVLRELKVDVTTPQTFRLIKDI
ncbi:MAG: radical SAM protein [Anaerolineales bacterium]|nr:radical SAM protein [Anaerolineales bacterium]